MIRVLSIESSAYIFFKEECLCLTTLRAGEFKIIFVAVLNTFRGFVLYAVISQNQFRSGFFIENNHSKIWWWQSCVTFFSFFLLMTCPVSPESFMILLLQYLFLSVFLFSLLTIYFWGTGGGRSSHPLITTGKIKGRLFLKKRVGDPAYGKMSFSSWIQKENDHSSFRRKACFAVVVLNSRRTWCLGRVQRKIFNFRVNTEYFLLA